MAGMTNSVCWACRNCCTCDWANHGTLPAGAKFEEFVVCRQNNSYKEGHLKKITACPNWELEKGVARNANFNKDGYAALQEAVVSFAVQDYLNALFILKIFPDQGSLKAEEARSIKRDCERFFCGSWFHTLCNLQGRTLSKRLRELVNETWEDIKEHYAATGKLPKSAPGIVRRNRRIVERIFYDELQ